MLIDTLIEDHNCFRGLLEQIAETLDDDPEGARLVLAHARVAIVAHGRAEARAIYVALPEDVHLAREEHAVVEALLDELVDTLVVDDAYRARIRIITDLLDRHLAEEEELLRRYAGRLERQAEAWVTAKSRELALLGDQDGAEALQDGARVIRGVD